MTTQKFESRVIGVVVVPVGSKMINPYATRIEIVDDGAGEYVAVTQLEEGGRVHVNGDEWAAIREAIDDMLNRCRA